jgi:NAD(P)H-hydrate epimerase
MEEIIDAINRSQKSVMAIDIPSGLNADTGQVMGVAVRADLTVTFGFRKRAARIPRSRIGGPPGSHQYRNSE